MSKITLLVCVGEEEIVVRECIVWELRSSCGCTPKEGGTIYIGVILCDCLLSCWLRELSIILGKLGVRAFLVFSHLVSRAWVEAPSSTPLKPLQVEFVR